MPASRPSADSPIDLKVPVPTPDAGSPGWEIAASVYLPPAAGGTGPRPVLVLLPGGGYHRHYFDLPVPGFSQAAHHVRQGCVVVAMDPLGAGDSSIPPMEVSTLPVVAAAAHAAVDVVLDRLREGTLAPGVAPVEIAGVVGAGQSLGGYTVAGMQARHRTFDGVALLGSSMAGTTIPMRPDTPAAVVPPDATPEQAAQIMRAHTDWVWAFHWPDPAPTHVTHPPRDLATLVAADIAGGLPGRRTAPGWGSLTYPGFAAMAMHPGVMAGDTARIDVPVLLARGTRDVCHSPAEEVAMFAAATDIAVFIAPEMAHMHNFATTRALLWHRLDEFVASVTRASCSPAAALTEDARAERG